MLQRDSYRRPIFETLTSRIAEPRGHMQVLFGPRQVGKTTVALQAAEAVGLPVHHASADETLVFDREWISAQWEQGRQLLDGAGKDGALLILDEVQKIPRWSDTVKLHWDRDTFGDSGSR